MRWLTVILGAIIAISVYLPWLKVSGFGMEDTVSGMPPLGLGGGGGTLTLIMGIICAGLAFLPMPKIRGGGHIAGGILALAGVGIYWNAMGGEALFMEITPGYGLYLCLAAAAAVIVIGIVELRQKGRIGEPAKEVAPSGEPQAEAEQPVAKSRKDSEVSEPPAFGEVRPKIMSEVGGIISDRNRLVAVAIGLIILAIFSSVAFQLPEAYTRIVGGLFVGSVIKIVIAAIMLTMLLSVRSQLTRVVTYYARRVFKVTQYPSRVKVSDKINGLSAELSNIVVIAIAWPLVAQIVNRLLLIDVGRNLGWISILVTLGFVAILLYRLYRGYLLLEPVLAVMGKAPQETPCPKCGTLNSVGAKFCLSCGAELQPTLADKATPVPLHCSKCGTENNPDAKFCQNCGSPLSITKQKEA